MLDMPLFNFFVLAIIFAIAGFTSLIFSFHCSKKVSKYSVNELETETMEIIIMNKPSKSKQWERALFIFKIMTLLFLATTLFMLSIFMYYDSAARKHGAYDDFAKKESINIIRQNIDKGFIDQSNVLPNDLKGCIIIYFKYGCSDCEKIHDDILDYINEKNVTNLYFVSTRSEKGIELLQQYSVDTVPSGIYIMKNPTGSIERYTEILYNMNAPASQTNTFVSKNFDKLLDYQNRERTIEQ